MGTEFPNNGNSSERERKAQGSANNAKKPSFPVKKQDDENRFARENERYSDGETEDSQCEGMEPRKFRAQ